MDGTDGCASKMQQKFSFNFAAEFQIPEWRRQKSAEFQIPERRRE